MIVTVHHLPAAALMGEVDRRLDMRHLVIFGIGRPVRLDHAVAHRAVVAVQPGILGVGIVIQALAPIGAALLVLQDHGLVDPVPDEAALQLGIFAERLPIALEVAQAVAHRMGIFAQDQRLGEFGARRIVGQLFDIVIHGREDVDIGVGRVPPAAHAVAEEVDQPRLVMRADPFRRRLKIGADTAFIAQRPEDDRRVVAVALDHALHPGEMRGGPFGLVAQVQRRVVLFLGEAQIAVALDIGLVHHVQAVLVGQIVPARIVGIVRGADRVDVGGLHQLDVLAHRFLGHDAEGVRIMLVAIDAADHDPLAVHAHLAARDLDGAETDAAAGRLDQLALRIKQLDQQRVEVGVFRAPRLHARNLGGDRRGGAGRRRGASQDRALAVEQCRAHGRRLGRARQVDCRRQRAVTIVMGQPGIDAQIADMGLRRGIECDRPLDPVDAPEVLILQIAAVRMAIEFDCDDVLAGLGCAADVEFGRELGVFRIADLLAVHPQIISRPRRPDVQQQPAPSEMRGDGDVAAIGGDLVQPMLDKGFVAGKGIAAADEDRAAQPLCLEDARYRHFAPGRHVAGRVLEADRPRLGIGGHMHPPQAIEREVIA